MNGFHFDDGADMRSGFHFVGIEAARRAAVHWAAFDGRDEHSRDARVQAKLGGAGNFGKRVGAPRWLADEGEVQRILQRRIGGGVKNRRSRNKVSEREGGRWRRVKERAAVGSTYGGGNNFIRPKAAERNCG